MSVSKCLYWIWCGCFAMESFKYLWAVYVVVFPDRWSIASNRGASCRDVLFTECSRRGWCVGEGRRCWFESESFVALRLLSAWGMQDRMWINQLGSPGELSAGLLGAITIAAQAVVCYSDVSQAVDIQPTWSYFRHPQRLEDSVYTSLQQRTLVIIGDCFSGKVISGQITTAICDVIYDLGDFIVPCVEFVPCVGVV